MSQVFLIMMISVEVGTCIGDECKLIDSFNDSRHIFFKVWCLDHILQRAEHARVHLACVDMMQIWTLDIDKYYIEVDINIRYA